MIWNQRQIILCILIISVVGYISGDGGSTPDNVPSDRRVHKCPLASTQLAVNVLPGTGWDNLENSVRGQVLRLNYKSCHSSPDGRLLLPDNVFLTPQRRSSVQLDSELFSHFNNFTSATARSINVDASYNSPKYQISGSFSYEHQTLKNKQIQEKSAISRVMMRYFMYSVTFQPDAELDPQFRNRILDIGAAVMKSEEDNLYPGYLSELLIRDFGTHFIRTIDAGAVLSKVDVLKSSYVRNKKDDSTSIKASASFSMTKIFDLNVKTSFSTNTSSVDEYEKNCASTSIETIGGSTFGSNFSLRDWEKDLDRNFVAVDRHGDPIYYAVTTRSMPELGVQVVNQIVKHIEAAIETYYSANTRVGCMNMKSPNFNDDANVDSGDCELPKVIFSMGGVYQQCYGNLVDCPSVLQVNPSTGSTSCPAGYRPVLLQSAQYSCSRRCRKFLFWDVNCVPYCTYYRLFWCAPQEIPTPPESASGYLFGGMYTRSQVNPITNAHTCPQYYIPLRFGSEATICLSSDTENSLIFSLPFGGFYSCNIGNPLSLANNNDSRYWSRGCATGYSEHLAVIDRNCQISYCVKATALSARYDPPLLRPPFMDLTYGPNITLLSSFTNPQGVELRLSDSGEWERGSIPIHKVVIDNSPKIIGLSVLGSFLIATLVAGVVLGYQRYQRRRVVDTGSYQNIPDDPMTSSGPTSSSPAIGLHKILTPKRPSDKNTKIDMCG